MVHGVEHWWTCHHQSWSCRQKNGFLSLFSGFFFPHIHTIEEHYGHTRTNTHTQIYSLYLSLYIHLHSIDILVDVLTYSFFYLRWWSKRSHGDRRRKWWRGYGLPPSGTELFRLVNSNFSASLCEVASSFLLTLHPALTKTMARSTAAPFPSCVTRFLGPGRGNVQPDSEISKRGVTSHRRLVATSTALQAATFSTLGIPATNRVQPWLEGVFGMSLAVIWGFSKLGVA